jgi:hypothetical protein
MCVKEKRNKNQGTRITCHAMPAMALKTPRVKISLKMEGVVADCWQSATRISNSYFI